MDMVAHDLAGDDVDLVLERHLPDHIRRPDRHLPGQHLLAVFRHPDKVHLQIRLGVGAQLITSHGDTINPCLKAKRGLSIIPERDSKKK